MNFQPITDWRNYRTASRRARLSSGAELSISEDATNAQVFLAHHSASLRPFGPVEFCMTPLEAYDLGAELMQAAVRQGSVKPRAAS